MKKLKCKQIIKALFLSIIYSLFSCILNNPLELHQGNTKSEVNQDYCYISLSLENKLDEATNISSFSPSIMNNDYSRCALPDANYFSTDNIEWIFHLNRIETDFLKIDFESFISQSQEDCFSEQELRINETKIIHSTDLQKIENEYLLPIGEGLWQIKANGYSSGQEIFYGKQFFLINRKLEENPERQYQKNNPFHKTIPVFLIKSRGYGGIDLSISTKDSFIQKIKVLNTGTILDNEYFPDEMGNIRIFYDNSKIPAGDYKCVFHFYFNDTVSFSINEIIQIRQNCCTNTWSDDFYANLSEEKIKNIKRTTFYVKGSNSIIPEINHNLSQDGSWLSPFTSIQSAIDTIKTQNDSKSIYRIYIDGNITPSFSEEYLFENNSSLITIDSDQPLFIEICGYSRNVVINANRNNESSSKGRVLTLKNQTFLRLRNITICGGYSLLEGGGIYIDCTNYNPNNISTLYWSQETKNLIQYNLQILENCSICNNYSEKNGGGIYIKEGAIYSENQMSICNNNAKGSGGGIAADNSAKNKIFCTINQCAIENNGSKSSGGGLYLDYALFDIQDSIISNNYSNQGGGITVGVNCSLFLKNCQIKENKAISKTGTGGGGLFSRGSGSKIYFQEGTIITHNLSFSQKNEGGGIVNTASSLYFYDKVTIENNFYIYNKDYSVVENYDYISDIPESCIREVSNLFTKQDIHISEPLQNTKVGITCIDSIEPYIFTKDFNTHNPSDNILSFFIPDKECIVLSNQNGNYILQSLH
ncbi:MAG: hypothetical protein MJ188_03180 [Treponema sp.]|nr:hypothetical protein [Treponema sp.]